MRNAPIPFIEPMVILSFTSPLVLKLMEVLKLLLTLVGKVVMKTALLCPGMKMTSRLSPTPRC